VAKAGPREAGAEAAAGLARGPGFSKVTNCDLKIGGDAVAKRDPEDQRDPEKSAKLSAVP
jgi:hypothetical protein